MMLQPRSLGIGCLGLIGVLVTWSSLPALAIAQIAPDNSLGTEQSQVIEDTVQGAPAELINGGAQRGVNLFHSFSEFNVGDRQRVYFANPIGVQNILSRVTGNNPSNILGTLGVNGSANLFLINPNGILFGPNARLDIRGSFLASTADSLVFDNGFQFSASNSQTPPLLTINVPVGLQFGTNPGGIRVQGNRQVGDRRSELRVGIGKTLALVGGDVLLDSGSLMAIEGRIELGSVAADSLVTITPTPGGWELSYQGVQLFQDIQLMRISGVVAGVPPGGTSNIGGSIQVQGRRIAITDGSYITTLTGGNQAGRNLTIRGSESVEMSGFHPEVIGRSGRLATETLPGATGDAGNLIIETKHLRVADGTILSASTRGAGNGGDLIVRAQSVEVTGVNQTATLPSILVTQANENSTGNAGNIIIETQTLRVVDGGGIAATTSGAGDGGNITVRAQSVELSGFHPEIAGRFGRLATETFPGSTGNAGNLTIETQTLRVADGTVISAGTSGRGNGGNLTVRAQSVDVVGFNQSATSPSVLATQADEGSTGNAGNMTIEVQNLRVMNGALITTGTFGSGDGGDLTVRAQFIQVSGFNSVNRSSSYISAQTYPNSTGNAGEIILTTDHLNIANRGEIRTTSVGAGRAGNITIQANSQITLTDEGRISSNTNTGQGNIRLTTPLLMMRRGSSITTNAADTGTGGNITIDADFIVSPPNENNDIIANAFRGSGGQITLIAQGIFGLDVRTREDLQRLLNTTNPDEFDPQRLPTNDITAFSQANPTIDTGTVTLQTPDLDPTQGLTALPTDLTDPSQLIAATCPADRGSSFAITGRGGLPEDPRQPLMGQVIWRDDRQAGGDREVRRWEDGEVEQSNLVTAPLVEAQGWSVDRTGTVVLVARQPQTNQSVTLRHATCALSNSSP